MPELPEVEALARALRPWLEGRCLLSFEPRRGGLRRPFPAGGASLVVGRPIRRVSRRAKYLLLELDGGLPGPAPNERDETSSVATGGCGNHPAGRPPCHARNRGFAAPSPAAEGPFRPCAGRFQLIFHLGMTGHLRVCPVQEALDRHDHLVCALDGGFHLRFNDPRRFGQVFVHRPTVAAPVAPELARLGPEPLDPGFTARALHGRLAPRTGPVKTVLLDQSVVAGLGNIYVAEALFVARIHPATPASRLTAAQVAGLHRAIRAVLRRAVAAGSTEPPQVPEAPTTGGGESDVEGPVPQEAYPAPACAEAHPIGVREETTYFPFPFRVYGRDGQPCRRCREGTIQRILQAGRSTFFCPLCQPAPVQPAPRRRGKSA